MATPMVAGAIALIKQYLTLSGQTKTPAEVENIFYNNGKTISEGVNNFSRIDVYSALLSLDIDAPNITLVSPADGSVNLSVNQTFTCNATDWQLANVTLKVWNSSGGLYHNGTSDLTGTSNETSFNLADMPEDTYEWNCLVYDNQGNSEYASANYSLTIGGVEVNMDSPVNNSYTNVNDTNFTCTSTSDSNYELSNVTFYLWNSSGDLINNSVKNISGTSNESIFNYTFEYEDAYSWKCLSINNNSDESSNSNFTITYDVTNPPIENISESVSTTSVTIGWGSDELVNASVNYGTSVSLGINSSNVDFRLNHSIGLSGLSASTLYYYNLTSCDQSGNCVVNGINSFTTSAAIVVTSSGGGGSSGEKIYYAPAASFSNGGHSQELKARDKLKFQINSGSHSLSVLKINSNHTEIVIASDPIKVNLSIGEERKFNLTSPYYYDLFVKLNSISGVKANLTIRNILENIISEEENPINESDNLYHTDGEDKADGEIVENEVFVLKNYFWVVVGFVLVLIGIIFGIIRLIYSKYGKTSLDEDSEEFKSLKNKSKKLKGKKTKKKHAKKRKKTKT